MKLFFVLALFALQAWGYPQFINKGYKNCIACHYNPYGRTALNDYGRGVAASAIADRLWVPKSVTDQDLSNRSGFLFSTPKNKWFRPALDYRGLYLARNMNEYDSTSEAFDEAEVVHMQMDANVTLQFGKRNNLLISGTYGILPNNHSFASEDEPEYISREHFIGYRPSKEYGIYVGKMDKIYGLGVPDHAALSKTLTQTGLQAPTHGVVLHYLAKDYELGGQAFIGDRDKPTDEHTEGFVGRAEYNITDNVRIGGTYMMDKAETNTKYMKAFLTKAKMGKQSSILFEFGEVDTEPESGDATTARYMFFQNFIYLSRGFYFINTIEWGKTNVDIESENFRIIPGLQYFPWQRVEIRTELRNDKVFSEDDVPEDSWSFLGQLHVWF